MTHLKLVPHSSPIRLTDWDFGFGSLNSEAVGFIEDVLIQELNDPDYGIRASLPVSWGPDSDGYGGPQPTDPTTIYVHLPFADAGHEVLFQFSLSDLVNDDMPQTDDQVRKLRDSLLALAKLVHNMHFPNIATPDLEYVEIPDSLTQNISLDDCWAWQSHKDFLTFINNEIATAQQIIDRIRTNKVRMEAARHHYVTTNQAAKTTPNETSCRNPD